MGDIFDRFYHQPFFARLCHTLVYCLQRELEGCDSVLDLGCGPSSPLRFCQNVKYSVGVEAFKPYFDKSLKSKIHSKYLFNKIEKINFPKKSFDAVILIDVLEHFSRKEGENILRKAEMWSRKKVIISTPNGYFPMQNVDDNRWQSHLSGWTVKDLTDLRYYCRGLAGLKLLYHGENRVSSMTSESTGNRYSNIKLKPKRLFYLVNCFFQIITYYVPNVSFEVLAVKKICRN